MCKNKREHLFNDAIWYDRASRKGKINHNAHSVYLMYYHLIMVVKYRRKVIDNPISERAKGYGNILHQKYGIVLEEWNHDIDHVHVPCAVEPKSELQ